MIPDHYFYYWSGQRFQYVHYLSILSVLHHCRVEKIQIHVEEAPEKNPYWKSVCDLDNIEVVPADFAHLLDRVGCQYADYDQFLANAGTNHRSDLIRYLLLAVHGGVYLDFDTLVVKDLKPLMGVDFFVGRQRKDIWGNEINGAVMGSRKDGVEAIRCVRNISKLRKESRLRTIKDLELWITRLLMPARFRWAEAGPFLLTRLVDEEEFNGMVYPIEYFQYWHHERWREIFSSGKLDNRIYIIHYFGSRSWKETAKINENNILRNRSIFGKAARVTLGTRLGE